LHIGIPHAIYAGPSEEEIPCRSSQENEEKGAIEIVNEINPGFYNGDQ
jgi:hypothetical protein